MPRVPLDTLLMISRVRLISKVPIIETDRLVRLYIDRARYRRKLVVHATSVTEGSYVQFENDDRSLTALAEEMESHDYFLTKHAQAALSDLVHDIFGDGVVYRKFKSNIQPLFEESDYLERISGMTSQVVDSTYEHGVDVARLIGSRPPRVPEAR